MLYSDTLIVFYINKDHLILETMKQFDQIHGEFVEELKAWIAKNKPEQFDILVDGDEVEEYQVIRREG